MCERLVDEGDLEKEVEALAREIAAQPPLAVQGAKRAVAASGHLPVREGLVVEAEAQAIALRSNDMREAITAFIEQRAPKYEGFVTTFRVRASGPLHGQVTISGASKNAGTKQMAAALLAPGITTLHNVPVVSDLEVMADLLRAVGAHVELLPGDEVRIDAGGELAPGSAVRARLADAGVVQRARAAHRPVRRGAGRAARRRHHRQPQGRHAPARAWKPWARAVEVEHGFVHAHAHRAGRARGTCWSSRASARPRT